MSDRSLIRSLNRPDYRDEEKTPAFRPGSFMISMRNVLRVALIIALLVVSLYTPAVVCAWPHFQVPTDRLSVYFTRSASDDPATALIALYSGVPAGGYIYIDIYSLTHPSIVRAILKTKKRGVQVFIITDSEQSQKTNERAALKILSGSGIPIKTNTFNGYMHMKVSIINGQWITTGSYNYSSAASSRNKENLLVIPATVDQGIINRYQADFEGQWKNTYDYR